MAENLGTGEPDTGEFLTIPQPSPASKPVVRFEFGAETHPGKVRDRNEDHYLVARLAKSMRVCKTSLPTDGGSQSSDEEGHIMIVADGMGGAAAGERASTLAVTSVQSFVLNSLKWFLHLKGQEENTLISELRQALDEADRHVMEEAHSSPNLWGMGTTLTMGYSIGADLYLVHAGDSRAYLFRDGTLDQLTADHTLVQLLVDNGALTAEAARHHSRRHVVTNVLGGPHEGVHSEIHKVRLKDGDLLLLCSDGLTEPVDDPSIVQTLAKATDPAQAAKRLVEQALEGGGPDNVTVIVGRYLIQ